MRLKFEQPIDRSCLLALANLLFVLNFRAFAFEGPKIDYLRLRVVAMEVHYHDGQDWKPYMKGSGTGFLINPDGYVLTAKHLVPVQLISDKSQWAKIKVVARIGDKTSPETPLEIVDVHPSRDAMLLRFNRRLGAEPYQFFVLTSRFTLGIEEVSAVGFPVEEDGGIKFEKASMRSDLPDGAQHGEVNTKLHGGFSGGPVLSGHQVVGLVESSSTEADRNTFKFVPIRSLRPWLSESVTLPNTDSTLCIWAVGNDGSIIGTRDGGVTWKKQPSCTKYTLSDVFFIDDKIGWASGADVTAEQQPAFEIIATNDGGDSWRTVNRGTGRYVGSLFFANAKLGWAAANANEAGRWKNICMRTDNGGKSWESAYVSERVASFFFRDSRFGWLVGGEVAQPETPEVSVIKTTTDGGRTWKLQSIGGGRALASVTFIDNFQGWAVGFNGTIFHTLNGGDYWERQRVNSAFTLDSVTFADERHGWITGIDVSDQTKMQGVLLATENGGMSWSEQARHLGGRFFSVSFVDEKNGWVVRDDGSILATSDGGKNWVNQYKNTQSLNKLYVLRP